jgi:soluble lytic murein transglycosylase-like protein
MAAALAAVPALARAQATPECASTPTQFTRQQMLAQAGAWRSFELPPGDPAVAEFGPQLDGISARLQAASDDDKGLPALRREFHDWKIALLKSKFRSAAEKGPLGNDFCAFVNGETRKAAVVAAISLALTQESQAYQRIHERLASVNAAESPFDGAAGRGGADGFVVLSPSAPDDPARYDKVRQILISEGANARVVDAAIREALAQHTDPLLVLSVINAESGFNPHAHSPTDARGLMQVEPDTGKGLGVRSADMLYDVQTNLHAGVKYLSSLWGQFTDFSMASLQAINPFSSKDVEEAVAAYNAGPGAVKNHHGVPPYPETQKYVQKVLSYYEKLKSYLVA